MISNNLQLHFCTVTLVHSDGTINAQSDRNYKFFENCLPVQNGSITSFKKNDKVIVMSEGAGKQQYAFGYVSMPSTNLDGQQTSVLPINDGLNQLSNLSGIVSRSSTDKENKVITSAAGVMIECTGLPAANYDPNRKQITEVSERYEKHTLPATVIMDHDENDCTTQYIFRTETDDPSWVRGMKREDVPFLNKGQNIILTIKNDQEILTIEQKKGDTLKSKISIDSKGDISVFSENDSHRNRAHTHDDQTVDHPAMAKMVHYMFQRVLDTVMDMIMVDAQGKAHSFNDPHVSAYANHNKLLRDSVLSQFTKEFDLNFPYSPQYTNEENRFPPDNPETDTLENDMPDNERQNDTILAYGPIKLIGDRDE